MMKLMRRLAGTKTSRKPARSFRPTLEMLERREVPTTYTTWTGGGDGHNWGDVNNWNGGLPDSTKVVRLAGATDIDFNVTANLTVAGLRSTDGTTDFTGKLKMNSSFSLRVKSSSSDANTGFQWTTAGKIDQSGSGANTASLIIDGGTDGTQNFFKGGGTITGGGNSLSPGGQKTEVVLTGGTTLQITASSGTIDDTISVGNGASDAGNELYFTNQTSSLNFSGDTILIAGTSSGLNKLLVDTNTTGSNTNIALKNSRTSGSPKIAIDANGEFERDGTTGAVGAMTFQAGYWQYGTGSTAIVKSDIKFDGTIGAVNYSWLISKGTLDVYNGSTIYSPNGAKLDGGTINLHDNTTSTFDLGNNSFTLNSGIINLHEGASNYNTLRLKNGAFTWSGGTVNATVKGGDSNTHDTITCDGMLTLMGTPTLNTTIAGTATGAESWAVLTYASKGGSAPTVTGDCAEDTFGATSFTVKKKP